MFYRFQILSFFLVWLLIPSSGFGSAGVSSDTLWNQTDNLGRKQGHWKKYYPNGKIMYSGSFKDDKPQGKMQRYYEDGGLRAELDYQVNPATAYVIMYFQNGQIGATGKYHNQKRDSIWSYYSFYSGDLTHQETYRIGVKEGPATTFYPEGGAAEIINWKDNMKHGDWRQFFEDSTLRLASNYQMDQLHGPYRVYTATKILILDGIYQQGKMDGDWKFYDKDGNLERTLQYDNGVIQNEEELEKWAKEFMDNVEKDLGKIPEPDLNNFFERSP